MSSKIVLPELTDEEVKKLHKDTTEIVEDMKNEMMIRDLGKINRKYDKLTDDDLEKEYLDNLNMLSFAKGKMFINSNMDRLKANKQ